MSTANNIKEVCPQSFIIEPIGQTTVDGYRSYEAIVGCANIQNDLSVGIKKGQGELAYFLAIEGDNDIYFIQKALRSQAFDQVNLPISKSNYKDFISSLLPISLCKKDGSPYECKK
jgi:hypothetical protein